MGRKKIKKGQVKIQQTAFMLIALTLFFVLVGLFVLGFGVSGIKQKASDLERERASFLASKIADSPELSCGDAFEAAKIDCVDLDKAFVLKNFDIDYSTFWNVDGLKIKKIYPGADTLECVAGNYPECGEITLIDGGGSYRSSFVALCRKEQKQGYYYNKCELGLLMVSYGDSNVE